MLTERLKVTGMSCGGCISGVTAALKQIRGVTDVKVSLFAGDAMIEYDERLASLAQLKSAVESAGYGVEMPNSKSDL